MKSGVRHDSWEALENLRNPKKAELFIIINKNLVDT